MRRAVVTKRMSRVGVVGDELVSCLGYSHSLTDGTFEPKKKTKKRWAMKGCIINYTGPMDYVLFFSLSSSSSSSSSPSPLLHSPPALTSYSSPPAHAPPTHASDCSAARSWSCRCSSRRPQQGLRPGLPPCSPLRPPARLTGAPARATGDRGLGPTFLSLFRWGRVGGVGVDWLVVYCIADAGRVVSASFSLGHARSLFRERWSAWRRGRRCWVSWTYCDGEQVGWNACLLGAGGCGGWAVV